MNDLSWKNRQISLWLLLGFLAASFIPISCVSHFSNNNRAEIIVGKEADINYRLLKISNNENADEKYPLILFLHGAQEDPEGILNHWSKEASKRRVMILAPHWTDIPKVSNEALLNLLKQIETRYPVDTEKVFLAGISAGGARSQKLIENNSGRWRGVIFMSFVPSLQWFQKEEKEKMRPLLFVYGMKDPHSRYDALVRGTALLTDKKIQNSLLVDSEAGHEYQPGWSKRIFDWISLQSKNKNGGFIPG